MGVEQLMRDRFRAALEYDGPRRKRARCRIAASAARGVTRDRARQAPHPLPLLPQDEVLMMLRLAAEFKIRIGTLQHILEGYKVADEIAKAGAGASSFADWWGYKMEAYDAIPDNAAMMNGRGVLTTINSDSGDLARG
jgi:hypothetical protein